jgi:DNA invertase Pin-like site-specific DNA recombinase
MIIGYARLSTDGQTLDAQNAALHEASCERVYSEKISGAEASIGKGPRCARQWRHHGRPASSIGWQD